MLVMKKSAGTPSSLYSPGRGRDPGDSPLIQAVGPDFSRLSRDLNRVVLKIQHQAEVAADCPEHGDYGSRRGSDQLRRGSGAREVTGRSASAELVQGGGGHRAQLGPRLSAPEQQYASLPRRLSSSQHAGRSAAASKVDRRQSFQDFKTFRDKFTGPLDFKNTLRSSSGGGGSRDNVSAAGGARREAERERGRKGRHYSEPRDGSCEERRGYFIESDFDFRSPPSTRDNSRERRPQSRFGGADAERTADYYAQDVVGGPRRGQQQHGAESGRRFQYGYLDLKQQLQSPTESLRGSGMRINVAGAGAGAEQGRDPLSPRRVEWADEVFSFRGPGTSSALSSRPGSRCESPAPRGILRHTASDPAAAAGTKPRSNTVELAAVAGGGGGGEGRGRGSREAGRSNTTELSFPAPQQLSRPTSLVIPQQQQQQQQQHNGQPLVKILLPDADPNNDSDDTLIEEKHETESNQDTAAATPKQARVVPPPLADWNRSQSFPPATSSSPATGPSPGLRKASDPSSVSASAASLLSEQLRADQGDLDLIAGDNESLRVRVGDLEKQVHDNNDEIKCLKATLAECLRKIGDVETKMKYSESRPRRRDLSEGSKSNRKAIYGSQDFSNRATFEIHAPPQRGNYAPRQR